MQNKIVISIVVLLLLSSCDIFKNDKNLEENKGHIDSWTTNNNKIEASNWTWKIIIETKEKKILKEIIKKEPETISKWNKENKWKSTNEKSIVELSEGIESIDIDKIMDLEFEELLK
jgi:hypothetical protein